MRHWLPDALIVRTAWVYGARGDTFLQRILHAAALQRDLRVVADQVGAPTHVMSLACAIWQLIAVGAHGLHHYTDDGAVTRHAFASAIQAEAVSAGLLATAKPIVPIRSAEIAGGARRPAYSVLDTSSTLDLLGRKAPSWRDELRAAVSALAAHG